MAVTTQTAQLPDYAKPYVQDMLAQTQAYTDINANPYQQYTGERVAGFQPLQQRAFEGAQTMAPSQYGAQGAGIAGLAANQALGAGAGFTPYQTGQFTGDVAQQYMNPYVQNVVDVQQREAQRQADIAGTQQQAQATQAGAFGGSRDAIMRAEAARNLAIQKGDIQAKGLQDAYTQGAARFGQEQQLGEQSRQYGAGLGLQGAATALQGASTLGTLGNQQFGQQKDISGLQYLYGTAQQQNQQAQNDVGYQNFQAAQNYPRDMLSFRSNMLNGLPMQSSTTNTPDPSALTQGIGLLGAIGSFFAKGGSVDDGGDPGIMALMASKYA